MSVHWQISVRQLKAIVDLLKDIVMEVVFVFDKGEILMTSVDPEKIAAVYMKINPNNEEYRCLERFEFPMYVQSLFRVLKGANRNETVSLIIGENAEELFIYISGSADQQFTIKKLQFGPPMPPTEIQYPIETSIQADAFHSSIRDLASIGKVLNLSVDHASNQVRMKTMDPLGINAVYCINKDRQDAVNINNRFIIKYIEKFCKPGLADEIHISIGPDLPFRCEWRMENGYLAMYLSPFP